MKLSSINLSTLTPESDLYELYSTINNTANGYPSDKSIVDIFQEMAAMYPDKTAVRMNAGILSYRELDKRSDQVAHWLLSRGVEEESVVAVYLDRSIEMIVAILGILKAGGAYLPLNIEYPVERNRYMLEEAKACVLIGDAANMREINLLQWQSASVHTVMCINTTGFYDVVERANPLMKKELWEFVGETAEDDIEGGGWKNSYNGEKFTREMMDEYADNAYLKLKPYLNSSVRVLEIGCASGITMYKIAPGVKHYTGTDLSASIIKYNEDKCREEGHHNISLHCLGADEISSLAGNTYDIIIINSVIQAFNGLNYLRQIIRKACDLLDNKGILFIGDVMDLEKKDELLSSVHEYKREHPEANAKLDFSNELFVAPGFFSDCRAELANLENVLISPKIFTIENELTRFRYDVILELNRQHSNTGISKHKYQFDAAALEAYPFERCGVTTGPRQLSNIMFTSGSTGMPKGVMIEHRCITRLVMKSNFLDINPSDKLLLTAEVSFDPSCMEIFGTLLNGATLCIIAKDVLLDAAALHAYMQQCDITILQLVSALFHKMAEQQPTMFSNVRKLVVGGEVLSPVHVRNVKAACPGLKIVNAYGPTENCVVSTAFEIDADYPVIPIGKPVTNSGIYIMDKQLRLQPVGITGELYLSGDGLARGYIGNSDAAQDKFIANPFVPGQILYRTGDLVRLRPDLNIEFIGRKDAQVKINGHRVELTEIENALKNISGITQAVVVLKGKNKSVCAYITVSANININTIRQLLMATLPEHMVPLYITKLDRFPMTTNAKIDINSLPEPEITFDAGEVVAPCENELEIKVQEIFKEVLGRDKIGRDQNFFQAGGHSLLATQVLSRINKQFGTGIRLKTIFNFPTIAGLAAEIAAAAVTGPDEINPVEPQTHYELSHAQQRLWIMDHASGYKTAYNMLDVYRFKGQLNIPALEKALRTIVSRHEILRTVFEAVDGHPKQRVMDDAAVSFALDRRDFSNETEATAFQVVNAEAAHEFDLAKGPLFRAVLLQMGEKDNIFLMSMHHIAGDGWSFWVLINELLQLYDAYASNKEHQLQPLRIQYKDYAAWQNNALNDAANSRLKTYWFNQLGGKLPSLNLPLDFPRTDVRNTKAEKIFFELPPQVSTALKALCQKEEVTLFMCLNAVLNVFLYSYTGQQDIIIGSPIAGRDRKELESQVGLYINTLALRSAIQPEKAFAGYLQDVKKVTLDAYEHQMFPFDVLVDELNIERSPNRSPLFDIGFTWQNIDGPQGGNSVSGMDDIEIETFSYDVYNVKTDAWFHGWETQDNGIGLSVAYNVGLFRKERIESMIEDFKCLAEQVAADSGLAIAQLTDSVSAQQKAKKMESLKKVSDSKFEKFFNVSKKPVNVNKSLITKSFLPEGNAYPLVIQPVMDGLILSRWIAGNKDTVQQLLHQHGGILFRNFNTTTAGSFEEVAAALSDKPMMYMDQSSPRTLLSEKTYTSTDHPEDQVINMHNELSYSHDWPMQILFFCLQPASQDGETPVADSRKVLQQLSESTRQKFREKGIMYVRNLVKGFGLSWQDVYQTSDKAVVEKYCTERGISFEWVNDDHLRVSWHRPAIRTHPVTGEETWFNHGFFFNAINLDESIHEAVGSREMLPFNTFYGDGTEIEGTVLAELRAAYEQHKVSFLWQQGDIILLDNMLMAHGRNSFKGDRKILVAMNNPFSLV